MKKSILRYWAPAFLWAAFIFYLSTLQSVSPPPFPYSDKVIHFLIYAVLGFFVGRALAGSCGLGPKWMIAASAAIVGLYGVSDEFHQMFVPTRTPELLDIVVDAVGGGFGSVIYGYKAQIFEKNR